MNPSGSVVVTTIASPNAVLARIAADCAERAMPFIVIGDTKSPADFSLPGCDFYSVSRQIDSGLAFARLCPTRHYARKNIGYLLAMRQGVDFIAETDDDNMPSAAFYEPLGRSVGSRHLAGAGWTNIYRYYADATIWPRGFPLDAIADPLPQLPDPAPVLAPIQQGLANANPDVDAIYRLTLPLPLDFRPDPLRIALGKGSWCPYNSQNTVHYREAFPLLYLPAHCSFRMTDIWRSFVAQRIAWTCGWSILFREPTVVQDRNDHDLMIDFEDEIPGYLNNRRIASALDALDLAPGIENISGNLLRCYRCLVGDRHIGEAELPLLEAFLSDMDEPA